MKIHPTRVIVRNSSMAVLLAATSILFGACATQPSTAMLPSQAVATVGTETREKPVTYAELHHMMSRLAEGPGLAADRDSFAAAHQATPGSEFVATNP
jgi:hypothetical protein